MNYEEMFSIIKKITYRDELPTVLKILGLNNRMCELGVQNGGFLWKLMTISRPKYLLGIDVWDNKLSPYWTQEAHDKCYNHVLTSFKKAESWTGVFADIVKGDHSVIYSDYEDGSFDFVYIDSDHCYEPTQRDIAQWWPKVKVGGIIAGHDYKHRSGISKLGIPFKWGVVEAVNEFVAENNIKYFHLTDESSKSWIIIKTE